MQIYREGCEPKEKPIWFFITNSGIGDVLCYMSAFDFIARNYPHLEAHVSSPVWLVELMAHYFSKYPKWTIHAHEENRQIREKTNIKGVYQLPINPTASPLLELGFIYFAETTPIPEGERFYVELDLEQIKLKSSVKNLGPDYFVMTPGNTAKSRFMLPETFNQIKEYGLSIGLKPVFLGNSKVGGLEDGQYTKFSEKYDLKGGLNLVNKTSLLEAAKIIEGSKFIIGLDNGLLHLGAMTKAPIVFGYTIAGPRQRRPERRRGGPIIDVTVSKEELACIHCQEFMRFTSHDFGGCMYNDFKCLDLLNFEKYKRGIDEALSYWA